MTCFGVLFLDFIRGPLPLSHAWNLTQPRDVAGASTFMPIQTSLNEVPTRSKIKTVIDLGVTADPTWTSS